MGGWGWVGGVELWPEVTWEQDVIHVVKGADEPLLIVVPGQVGVVGVGDLDGMVT